MTKYALWFKITAAVAADFSVVKLEQACHEAGINPKRIKAVLWAATQAVLMTPSLVRDDTPCRIAEIV